MIESKKKKKNKENRADKTNQHKKKDLSHLFSNDITKSAIFQNAISWKYIPVSNFC